MFHLSFCSLRVKFLGLWLVASKRGPPLHIRLCRMDLINHNLSPLSVYMLYILLYPDNSNSDAAVTFELRMKTEKEAAYAIDLIKYRRPVYCSNK